MKKRILIILVSLVYLTGFSVPAIAENHETKELDKKNIKANPTTQRKTEVIVFTGIPNIKLRVENGNQATPEKLSQAKSIEYKCTITKMNDKYYWATRENVELIPVQSGVWTTFVATTGGGYVRVIDPEMKKKLFKEGELPYEYSEHLLLGLSTLTYYGSSFGTSKAVSENVLESTEKIDIDSLWIDRATQAMEKIEKFGDNFPDSLTKKVKHEIAFEFSYAAFLTHPEILIKKQLHNTSYHLVLNHGDKGMLDVLYTYDNKSKDLVSVGVDQLPKDTRVVIPSRTLKESFLTDYIIVSSINEPDNPSILFSLTDPFSSYVLSE